MRIIHTCLRYPPATGGVETYVKNIVDRTRSVELKRDVRVLTSKLRTHGPPSELNPNLLLDDPMHVQRLHHAATPLVSYPRLQALSYYLGHHRPDIVEGHSFWYQPADTAARYARKNNLPFIFHPYYYENETRRKAHWRLYKKTIGRRTFTAADIVVVISPHEQSLIKEARLPVKRFELIPPGVDVEAFKMPQPNPYLQRGIKGRILLSVGRVAQGKGLEDLIIALSSIVQQEKDIQLAIVGEDFGATQQLQQQAADAGLTQHVHFLGKLSNQELIGAYQAADILVHPSRYEAFGIVLAEALAATTPVVARNTAAIPYVVPHGQAGILFNSIDELTKTLLTLLRQPDRMHHMAQTGQRHIKKSFSWEKSAARLLSIYAEYAR